MPERPTTSGWTRHLFYRAEHTRTTWKLRIGLLTLVALGVWLTSGWWTVAIARSLVCEATVAPSDAILVENFDPDYLLFQRARELRNAGIAPRVLVPVWTDRESDELNDVSLGFVQVMARVSRIGDLDFIPVHDREPITLNVARDLEHFFYTQHIRSVVVVTTLFRSRRSALVYGATLGRRGIVVRCDPVQGSRGASTWIRSWHGIQEVAEQSLKLSCYQLLVLPWLRRD